MSWPPHAATSAPAPAAPRRATPPSTTTRKRRTLFMIVRVPARRRRARTNGEGARIQAGSLAQNARRRAHLALSAGPSAVGEIQCALSFDAISINSQTRGSVDPGSSTAPPTGASLSLEEEIIRSSSAPPRRSLCSGRSRLYPSFRPADPTHGMLQLFGVSPARTARTDRPAPPPGSTQRIPDFTSALADDRTRSPTLACPLDIRLSL